MEREPACLVFCVKLWECWMRRLLTVWGVAPASSMSPSSRLFVNCVTSCWDVTSFLHSSHVPNCGGLQRRSIAVLALQPSSKVP